MLDGAIKGKASREKLVNQVALVNDKFSFACILSCGRGLCIFTLLLRRLLRLFVSELKVVRPAHEEHFLWDLL